MSLRNVDESKLFHNPLLPDGADPWIVVHNGVYHFLSSGDRELRVRRARSINQLYTASSELLWRDATPDRSRQFWAPELYRLPGADGWRWYLYYCASDGDHMRHRCHVLQSAGDDPAGPYAYKAKLRTDPDDALYAIDAGVIRTTDGRLYFVWAGHPGHRVFISRMSDPWTTAGVRAQLETSGFGCPDIREGPVALVRQGRVFLFYSCCDTGTPDYKLGMLIADENSDLADPRAWRQHPEPLLTRCDEHGVYGPGHNGFFQSPDGTQDWIIYHAKTTPLFTYRLRTPRAQRVLWDDDGLPRIGKAVSLADALEVPSGDPGGSLGPEH